MGPFVMSTKVNKFKSNFGLNAHFYSQFIFHKEAKNIFGYSKMFNKCCL